jgi:hypothetical protein
VTKGPNAGCEKITIKVDPNGTIVTDVHLWLGRRIHDAAPPKTTKVTTIGDPGNYRQSDDPLPTGWNAEENGVAKANDTEYSEDWVGPQLAGAQSFSVLYCGTQKLEKQTIDKEKKVKKSIKLTTTDDKAADKFLFGEFGFSTYGKDGGFDE